MFEEHRPRLLAVAARRLDPALGLPQPDDLVQDAFVAAVHKWGNWERYQASERPLSPFAWLYRLLQDQLILAFQRIGRRGQDQPLPEGSTYQFGMSLFGPGGTPSRTAECGEVVARVRQAIDDLSPADREIITMHDFEGLTFPEIGEVLGLEVNTANVRHIRAVRRLRKLLEAFGGTHP
jgi:RNA polymerase sigma-70 factor (ECF subfamily)